MSLLYNIGDMRRPYNDNEKIFTIDDLVSKEPFQQFGAWFEEACKCKEILEPNAMFIATATKSGVPSSRVVLLKGYNNEGFTFFTKYTSQKGQEIQENPHASLCFFWDPLKKSIRIDGKVNKISQADSTGYFNSRPRPSQIAAHVSCSMPKVISSRDIIQKTMAEMEKEFEGKAVPKPNEWGGYIVVPSRVEFWQGQTDRTHDRILFRRKTDEDVELNPELTKEGMDGWLIERLTP